MQKELEITMKILEEFDDETVKSGIQLFRDAKLSWEEMLYFIITQLVEDKKDCKNYALTLERKLKKK